MIASGFKPVGWVAGVATAALGCYMLSLNVASERAELASVERQIILAKRDIRALQTELGTRGRLQQLEHWNSEVLALSAPGSDQFLKNAFTLASYNAPEKNFDEEMAKVQLASAEGAVSQPATRPAIARQFATAPSGLDQALVRRASLVVGEATPFVPASEAAAKRTAPPTKATPASSKPIKTAEVKPVAVKPTSQKPVADKPKPAAKSGSLIDDSLAREIVAASKAENVEGSAGR